MAGKGSRARPLSVSKSQFDENWDKIFNKKVSYSEALQEDDLVKLAKEITDADKELADLAIELKNKTLGN